MFPNLVFSQVSATSRTQIANAAAASLRFGLCSRGLFRRLQAFLMHFRMKLFFAAPESLLPPALTAFGKHACRLHFLTKLFRAAPASGLPFLPTALLAQAS
jgi:hypothetical protein